MRVRAWLVPVVAALAVAAWVSAVSSQSAGPVSLDQGWNDRDRAFFYTTSQGSQLLPYSWYLALEQPGGGDPFNADHLSRYGYLENGVANPDNLPLGFVKDIEQDQIGLTCAACHTNQVRYGTTTWRIDGGPTDADTWAFLFDLGASLAETAASPNSDRFKRFAVKVNTRTKTPDATLYAELKKFSEYFTRFIGSSRTVDPWGRARIDAFGMIFNRATGIDLDNWDNTAKPNAPVSVPFLWDTHWHDVVQWNGSAPNTLAFHRLGRNVGEVLGVFASADIRRRAPLPTVSVRSSARRANLLKIEHLLGSLRSPQWPAELPAVDQKLVAQGQTLYDTYCVTCHAITPRDRPLQRMTVSLTPISVIGTDPTMAMNAKTRMAKSGVFEGVRVPLLTGSPTPAEVPSVELTLRVAVGAILAPPNLRALAEQAEADEGGVLEDLKADQDDNEKESRDGIRGQRDRLADLRQAAGQLAQQHRDKTLQLQYKGRPLDGIWATAPYLHNGSVPTLADLLKPESQRPDKFFVGNREFDPKNVGFSTAKADGAFEFDTSKPGNRNTGHGAYRPKGGGEPHEFSEAERMALVEYMKTL